MEPKGSLPCTQKSSHGPYPDPEEFNPHPHNLHTSFKKYELLRFLRKRSELILSLIYLIGLHKKNPLCLIYDRAMKTYWEVEIKLHVFLTSAQDCGECSAFTVQPL
jgi:hypothetical protein